MQVNARVRSLGTGLAVAAVMAVVAIAVVAMRATVVLRLGGERRGGDRAAERHRRHGGRQSFSHSEPPEIGPAVGLGRG